MNVTSVFKAVADFSQMRQETARMQRELNQLRATAQGTGQAATSAARPLAAMGPAGQQGAAGVNQYTASLNQASTASGEFQKKTEGNKRTLLSMIQGLTAGKLSVIGFTTAVGVGLARALYSGFQRFTTIEDSTKALTISLGDAGKAATFLGKILDIVRGTPFNLDQFAEAGKNLVAFGADAEKVPGILRAVGESAAASGSGAEAVAGIVEALGEATATGRITGDTIARLSQRGVPAIQILANSFGVTAEKMRDMISDGLVPAEEGIDKLTKGIMEGTRGAAGETIKFGGSMAGLRTTLSGVLGGMQAAVARFGAGVINTFQGPLKSGIISATEFLDRAQVTVVELLNRLDPVGAALVRVFEAVRPGAEAFLQVLGATAFLTFVGTLETIVFLLNTVATVVDALPEPLQEVLGVVLGLHGAFVLLSKLKVFDNVQSGVRTVLGFLERLAASTQGRVRANAALVAAETAVVKANLAVIASTRGVGAAQATTAFATQRLAIANAQLATAQTLAATSTGALRGAMAFLTKGFNPYVIAVGAAVAAGYLLIKWAEKKNQMDQTIQQGSEKLAKSLNLEYKAIDQIKDSAGNAVPNMFKFRQENEKLIEQLEKIQGAYSQEAFLIRVGFDLVSHGQTPEQAFEAIKRLAREAGIELPVGLDPSDLVDVNDKMNALRDQYNIFLQDLARAPGNPDPNSPLAITFGKKQRAQIQDLSNALSDMGKQGEFGQLARGATEFEASLRSSGLTLREQNAAQAGFYEELSKNLGVSKFGFEEINKALKEGKEVGVAFWENVAKPQSGATADMRAYANALLSAYASTGDLTAATNQVNAAFPQLASVLGRVGDNANAAAVGIEQFRQKMAQSEADAKEFEEAVTSLRRGLDSFTDLGSVYADTLSEAKNAAQEAAQAQADAVNDARKRAKKHSSDMLKEQKDGDADRQRAIDAGDRSRTNQMRDRHQRELDALKASGQATQENVRQLALRQVAEERANKAVIDGHKAEAKASKESADSADDDYEQKAASAKDFVKEVFLSIQQVADAETEAVNNAIKWQDNLRMVATRFGPEVANRLREMGKEGKKLAEQLGAPTLSAPDQAAGEKLRNAIIKANELDQQATQRVAEDTIRAFLEMKKRLDPANWVENTKIEEIAKKLNMSPEDVAKIVSGFGDDMQKKWAALNVVRITNPGKDGEAFSAAFLAGIKSNNAEIDAAVMSWADMISKHMNPIIVALGGKPVVREVPEGTTGAPAPPGPPGRATTAERAVLGAGGNPYATPAAAPTGPPASMGKTWHNPEDDYRRYGGVYAMAAGAVIQPAHKRKGLLRWAEGESMDAESYIPIGGASDSNRNIAIWAETGRRLAKAGGLNAARKMAQTSAFARGAVVDRLMRPSFPTHQLRQFAPVTAMASGGIYRSGGEEPTVLETSSTTQYLIPNATIVANDPKDLYRKMQAQARLRALAGDPTP